MTKHLTLLATILLISLTSTGYCAQLTANSETSINTVSVSCDYWPGTCNQDGSGTYFEIIRAIYNMEGIKVNHRLDPFIRGLKLVRENKVDFMAGAYKLPYREEVYNYPNIRLITENVSVFRHPATPVNADKIHDGNVSYIRGYNYKKYLSPKAKAVEITRVIQGVRMVISGRSNYFINPYYDTVEAITTLKKEDPNINIDHFKNDIIDSIPIYLLFQKNERGEKLAEIYDKNFKILFANGTIKQIFYEREIGKSYYYFPEITGNDTPMPMPNK